MENPAKEKRFVVPVFIPHVGCPHTCVFCNQKAITGNTARLPSTDELKQTIERFLCFYTKGPLQISFYGGTFLGLPEPEICRLLSVATAYIDNGKAGSLRFSTRPDTITEASLNLLKPYPVRTIELGAQSLSDEVLNQSGRGHNATATVRAANRLRDFGYETGIQLMTGLPGDSEETSLATARKTVSLRPDFVRIYPALVFRGSGLEHRFRSGNYTPLTLNECITTVKKMYLLFRQNRIAVHRMGLQSSIDFETGDEIISGPWHPAFGHLVFSEIFLDMGRIACREAEKEETEITLWVHPSDISKMRGLKNHNISVLKKDFGFDHIRVRPDISMAPDTVRLSDNPITISSLYNHS